MADTIDLIDSDGGEEEELADDEEETDVDDEDKAVKEGEEDEGDEEEELKEGEEDEDDEDCELMESEYADFGLIVDERKDRDTSSASSSFSSVPSTSVSSPSSSSSLHPTPHSSSISSSPSVPSSSVPSASLSSSSSSSSSSTLHQELQQQQVQADERLAHNLFLHENPHLLQPPAAAPASSSSSSSPPFAASSSHPHPGWISSHPDDPSNNPPLRARLIAQHHEHLNSSSPFVDVHSLFLLYAHLFFFNQLQAVSVRWSKRMTSCAGLCRAFDVQRGGCEIALSEALLKFRSKKEVVETLLHEMIHAYLFVSHLHKHDHDDHGPYFCRYMEQINAALGLSISVYHTFFQEVKHFKVHVWQCQGRCRLWKPYHGKVARVANRKPSLADKWFAQHQTNCGGEFVKVAGPSEAEMKEARKERARRRRQEKKAEKESKDKRDEKSKDRKRGVKQTDLRDSLTPSKRGREEVEVEESKTGVREKDGRTATARAEAEVAEEKEEKPKKRRKRMKGKGHVLGTGQEEEGGKKKRKPRKKGAADDATVQVGGGQQGRKSDSLHTVPAIILPSLSPPLQPAQPSGSSTPSSSPLTSVSPPSSASSSSPRARSAATSSSPAVSSSSAVTSAATVARRGTNIFALMQARGEGAKVAQLLHKAHTATPQ